MTAEGKDRHDALIADIEGKRGYVLTYHRMLANTAPELLAAYDAFYERLTLNRRVLTEVEREMVWAALLTAAREGHGTLHLKRGVKAGMDGADFIRAIGLSAACESWPAYAFASEHWHGWTKPADLEARYLAVFEAAARGVSPALAELCAITCHAALRTHAGMAIHVRRGFKEGLSVGQVGEALSYMLLPCGGPTLIDAVECWAETARRHNLPGPYRD